MLLILNAISSGSLIAQVHNALFGKSYSAYYSMDDADILSNETEKYIDNKNGCLQYNTGAEIILVTADTLGGADIAETAFERFNELSPGDGYENNGVLVFIAESENKWYAVQGRGIEDGLSAGTLALILEKAASISDISGFDAAVRSAFDEIVFYFENMYSISVNADHSPSYYRELQEEADHEPGLLINRLSKLLKRTVKFAVRFFFSVIGLVAGIVFLIVFSDKKKKTEGTYTPPSFEAKKENKNPYSRR